MSLSSEHDESHSERSAAPSGDDQQLTNNSIQGESAQEPIGAVPPGYDWPTHGGYLGCLLGLMVSCLVSGFVGSTLFVAINHYHLLPLAASVVLFIVVAIAVVYGFARAGWMLGKRLYREYPSDDASTTPMQASEGDGDGADILEPNEPVPPTP